MNRQFAAPIQVRPVDDARLTLAQAQAFLAHFLTHDAPHEATSRALLARLEGGLRHDLENGWIPGALRKNKKRKRPTELIDGMTDSLVHGDDEDDENERRRKKKADRRESKATG